MIVLNDQGGAVMSITEDITATLRAQDHGRPPIICLEGHIVDRNTAQNGRGWAEGYAYTLNSTDRHAVVYEKEKIHDPQSLGSAIKTDTYPE